MAVSIHDIARELNLSAMTVSRVLGQSARGYVAPATRERVLKAAREMGYRSNRNAQALASGRTHTIALWIDHLHSSVYSQIADACRAEVQRTGQELTVCEMNWHFTEPGHRQLEWMVDGIIAVDPPVASAMAVYLADAVAEALPRVQLGSGLSVSWEGDYVRTDLQDGTRAAIEHLLRAGCRRIAYSVPAGIDQPGRGNFDAYAGTMRAAGLQPECIVQRDLRMPAVRQATADHIRAHGKPDGLFCHFDELAIAGFRALRDLGLRVPDDVLVIGCEGNEFMDYFDPPLSTIAMPIKEMCQRAWQLLQKRIAAPDAPPDGVTLPYEFRDRPSSRPHGA
jgi:DNA-binding LacI/PurR family transcriptional regulator